MTGKGLTEHTTGKGKVLRGVVRKDMTLPEAKAIDPYAFKKDGGMFIREAHLDKLAARDADVKASAAPAAAPAPAPAVDKTADKARWLKNVAGHQRLVPEGGATITGVENGRVVFAGDPGTTKAGRALRDTVEEAIKAGATAQEVADAAMAKAPAAPAPAPAPTEKPTLSVCERT